MILNFYFTLKGDISGRTESGVIYVNIVNLTYKRIEPNIPDNLQDNNQTANLEESISLSQNSALLTEISPNDSLFPDTDAGNEEEFKKLCSKIKKPVQILPKGSQQNDPYKNPIVWNPKDPLHFFQSLAFILRTESLTSLAVSSFTDSQGVIKLYIASNKTMTESQQGEITDIITLFLELKPPIEILSKVLPRQLSYVIKQLKNFTISQLAAFNHDFSSPISNSVRKLLINILSGQTPSLDEIQSLLLLNWDKRKDLRSMKAGKMENSTGETKQIAYHLCKMFRILEEIDFVAKKVELHQTDKLIQLLSKTFIFIENENNVHAEIIILKTATDICDSKTLYIGVSKRPCYCCSLLFKEISESKTLKFKISIVSTNGKLYGKWNKIEGYFEKEFNLVWEKVVKNNRSIIEKKNRNGYFWI